jgi:predicted component of type VI protein secretion system
VRSARVRDEAPVSFLGRLRGRGAVEPAQGERFRREVAAIVRNLEAIFNTKKGVGCVIPDYGLGDWEGRIGEGGECQPRLATKDILDVLGPEIEAQIRRFEPRVTSLSAQKPRRDGRLRVVFTLDCVVEGRPVRLRVALHAVYRDVTVEAEIDGLDGRS